MKTQTCMIVISGLLLVSACGASNAERLEAEYEKAKVTYGGDRNSKNAEKLCSLATDLVSVYAEAGDTSKLRSWRSTKRTQCDLAARTKRIENITDDLKRNLDDATH